MGIDTTFQPKTPTYVVDSSAAVAIDARQLGVTSWRIVPKVASGIIKWGAPPPAAAPVQIAPAVGAVMPNQLSVNLGAALYIEGVGAFLQFIGNAAFATSYFEVTGGQGGCSG